MGRCGKISAVLSVSLIVAVPAAAQEAQRRSEYEELTQRPKPQPEIPRDLAEVIPDASPDRLLVSGVASEWQPESEEEWQTMSETGPRLTLEWRANETAVSLTHTNRENACHSLPDDE